MSDTTFKALYTWFQLSIHTFCFVSEVSFVAIVWSVVLENIHLKVKKKRKKITRQSYQFHMNIFNGVYVFSF